MSIKPYMGTKPTTWANASNSEFRLTPGIYKGIVKQIDTKTRTGRIKVYISEFGGNNPDLDSNWQPVSYASPFGGYTTGLLNQSGSTVIARNDFQGTQQSYGFFTSPPDIGSIVLCCFPHGAKTEGYWFACVNPNLSQHMIPAVGSVPYDKIDPLSVPDDIKDRLTPGFYYPCGEFNQNGSVYNDDWANALRPLHVPLALQLINQGLDGDPLRGPISSSAQRDPISTVYGFSTPGRPLGSQDPANNPNLQEALRTGDFNAAEYIVSNRVGGHSLIMDDGDIYGKDNLVRLRTAAGHQILMNDPEGFIYISNSKGTAWVELTKEGDVMIYSQRNLSVRSMGDMMFHSDRNINLNARGSVQVNAGLAVKLQGQAVEATGKRILNLYGQQTQIGGASTLALRSAGGMGIQAGGTIGITGSKIALNGGGGSTGALGTPSGIPSYLLPDVAFVNGKWAAQPSSFTSICPKVPTHEPYIRGSIAQVVAEQEALADELSKLKVEGDATTDIEGKTILPATVTGSVGVDQASGKAVDGKAPTEAFIKQPDPKSDLGNLNQNELKAYMAQVGYNESGGKYDTTNQFGYQGKYQMGSLALQDLGYVRKGTPQTPEALNNPNNWTGKDGITSSADFLASPSIQENAMYDYTKRNYAALQKNGLVTADTPNDVTAGLLQASHLVGVGGPSTTQGVYNWYTTGASASDANGTTAEKYFNRGRYSQTQVPVITASTNSKIIAT